MIDLNHKSGHSPGAPQIIAPPPIIDRINAHIDAGVMARRAKQPQRTYLGASRLGDPCARKLGYECMHVPVDVGAEITGHKQRIFDAGHLYEDLAIQWFREGGFDLRTRNRAGEQFGFVVADGQIQGHIDGVIVAGPDIGVEWPTLWECKSFGEKYWQQVKKHSLKKNHEVYDGQVHINMAYMELERCIFTVINKNTQELHHELIPLDQKTAQAVSDRGVQVVTACRAGELLPRIATKPDYYLCRMCSYTQRCWSA